MAYELLQERDLLPKDRQKAVREVAELAAKRAPGCELPVTVAKVMPSGIEFG